MKNPKRQPLPGWKEGERRWGIQHQCNVHYFDSWGCTSRRRVIEWLKESRSQDANPCTDRCHVVEIRVFSRRVK